MKSHYIQIFHHKTEEGWQPGKLRATAVMHPEDAAAVNRHFNERGIVCVPKNEYDKYLKNARLLN